jgi:hypothetical protein
MKSLRVVEISASTIKIGLINLTHLDAIFKFKPANDCGNFNILLS